MDRTTYCGLCANGAACTQHPERADERQGDLGRKRLALLLFVIMAMPFVLLAVLYVRVVMGA